MTTAMLDLFAGTGVGVAAQRLGIPEYGVEIMSEAVASRDAAGFQTPYKDAWDIDAPERLGLEFDTLWASPPCQTFSVAGKGAGRKALDEVLEAVRNESWKNVASLKQVAESSGDDRTALVLVPLAYVWRYKPAYVSLEQVPTVLPVWEAYAEKMREQGYSVWTGYLHSEQYGVPQTRKRAFLIARKDGVEAAPPEPTHSRYYSRTPEKLDPGVEKWVTMEEAIGRGGLERPYFTVSSGHNDPHFVGGSSSRLKAREAGIEELSEQEGATLQVYPADFPFQGSKSKRRLQIGNAVPPKVAEAVLKTFL